MPQAQKLLTMRDTQALAEQIAPRLREGDVVALKGDLGAGKTAFARFLIQALSGHEVEVTSPTFTLLQTYDTPKGEVWHYDLYRIDNESALIELGLEESTQHITLIEWPERLGNYKLPITMTLHFMLDENGGRSVAVL